MGDVGAAPPAATPVMVAASTPAPASTPAATPVAVSVDSVDSELAGLTVPFKATVDMDFSPPTPGVLDLVNGSLKATTVVACAQACIDKPGCNMATWMGFNPNWTVAKNCYLKTVTAACKVQAVATPTPGAYLLNAKTLACAFLTTAVVVCATDPLLAFQQHCVAATPSPKLHSMPLECSCCRAHA
jgi:hypothetical protein